MGFLACADAPNGPLAPPLPAAGDHAALADWFAERGIQVLRRKLSDGADNPTYLFTERGVGYRMPKGLEPEAGALRDARGGQP